MSELSAQTNISSEHRVFKEIDKVLSDFKYNKDSLIIFAINFTLTIEKKGAKMLPNKIIANDSLAYRLFPSYRKLANIDFSSILGTKSSAELVIPILIYGSSPDKMIYKDRDGNPLVNLNSAVNASLALISDKRYNNLNSSAEPFGSVKSSKHERLFKNKTIMEPYIITILNIP